MFGRKLHARLLEVVEELRAEVAAERAARNAELQTLHVALSEAQERATATEMRALHLQATTTDAMQQISQAVNELVQACDLLGKRVHNTRAENRAIIEVIGHLIDTTTSHAIAHGGSREFGHPDEPQPGVATEVWCRYQDRWVGGFEVAEALQAGNERRYRIRRTSDGSVLPEAFSRADLRVAKHS